MTGVEQLHPKNHDLYVRVQKMLNARWKYEAICDELGLVGKNRVNELCEWFIAYRTPKQKPMVRTGEILAVPVKSKALMDQGVRLATWERQRTGARKALEAMGL